MPLFELAVLLPMLGGGAILNVPAPLPGVDFIGGGAILKDEYGLP